jgi:hypothetical protein
MIGEFRSHRSNTLRGFADVILPSGLTLKVNIHQGADHCWVGYPAAPKIDSSTGVAQRDEKGKIIYQDLVGFTTREVRDRLTQQILHALNGKFPDALDRTESPFK